MNDRVRCTLCGWSQEVSAEDPDAVVNDVVGHAVSHHGFDPRLGLPKTVVLTLGSNHTDGSGDE